MNEILRKSQEFNVLCENHDLWCQLADLLIDLPDGLFRVSWIPSHLDLTLCTTTLEEWIAVWNNVADELAVRTNASRSDEYHQLKHGAQQHFALWAERI